MKMQIIKRILPESAMKATQGKVQVACFLATNIYQARKKDTKKP
jgi:hypothetical protein